MKKSVVTVTADVLGNVVGVSPNNPEYGYIRVESYTNEISNDGWLKPVRRSALIKGKVEDLVEADFKVGDTIPGKIVVRESFEPVNPENTEKGIKIAGASGIICRVDDQPIYRDTVFTTDMDAQDVFIQHSNTDEIKEAMAANRSLEALVNAKREGVTL